jgi:DNA topoisomerase-1
MFEPIVEKLNSQAIIEKKDGNQISDRLLGVDTNNKKIYTGTGKYGPYVKIETDDSKKWRYYKLTEMTIENVDIEHALKLLEFPKMLGKLSGAIVSLNDGPHGLYLKYNGKNYSIKDKKIDEINIDIARGIIEQDPFALKSFKVSNKIINIKNGDYGNYIQIVSNNKKQNISIPTKYNIDTITIDDVLKIISDKNGVLKKK